MKDYEQMYYDTLYELNKLKTKNKELEQELEIYKSMQKNKDLKKVIVDMIVKYLNESEVN